MRILLFIIGCMLIAGGVFAIKSPRAAVLFSSGPDVNTDMERGVIDNVAKERIRYTGYGALLLGAGVCAAGFFLKDLKVPAPHDTSA